MRVIDWAMLAYSRFMGETRHKRPTRTATVNANLWTWCSDLEIFKDMIMQLETCVQWTRRSSCDSCT
jgi:hypothetical protein